MKIVTIKNFEGYKVEKNLSKRENDMTIRGPESMQVSDGFHTFDELYDHRVTLFIVFCKALWQGLKLRRNINDTNPQSPRYEVWRSLKHSDGSSFEGWYILGIEKGNGEQLTYHIPMDRWSESFFAETLETAPEFDGHTPADVITRLKDLII